MNRSHFLRTIIPAGLGLLPFSKAVANIQTPTAPQKLAIPRFLVKGDTVGITCPGSPLEIEEAQDCIQ
jgi:hypothetical protein